MKASVFLLKPAEADQIEGNIGGKSDETADFCNIVVTDDDVHAGSDSMGGKQWDYNRSGITDGDRECYR